MSWPRKISRCSRKNSSRRARSSSSFIASRRSRATSAPNGSRSRQARVLIVRPPPRERSALPRILTRKVCLVYRLEDSGRGVLRTRRRVGRRGHVPYALNERLAAIRPPLHTEVEVDRVTAEIVRGAFETICFEVATHVARTATSAMINQSSERNASILDAHGRLAGCSIGIPQLMFISP